MTGSNAGVVINVLYGIDLHDIGITAVHCNVDHKTATQSSFKLTFSLNTDIISKKSSKVNSPSLDDENTLQILSLKGFTCRERESSLIILTLLIVNI